MFFLIFRRQKNNENDSFTKNEQDQEIYTAVSWRWMQVQSETDDYSMCRDAFDVQNIFRDHCQKFPSSSSILSWAGSDAIGNAGNEKSL